MSVLPDSYSPRFDLPMSIGRVGAAGTVIQASYETGVSQLILDRNMDAVVQMRVNAFNDYSYINPDEVSFIYQQDGGNNTATARVLGEPEVQTDGSILYTVQVPPIGQTVNGSLVAQFSDGATSDGLQVTQAPYPELPEAIAGDTAKDVIIDYDNLIAALAPGTNRSNTGSVQSGLAFDGLNPLETKDDLVLRDAVQGAAQNVTSRVRGLSEVLSTYHLLDELVKLRTWKGTLPSDSPLSGLAEGALGAAGGILGETLSGFTEAATSFGGEVFGNMATEALTGAVSGLASGGFDGMLKGAAGGAINSGVGAASGLMGEVLGEVVGVAEDVVGEVAGEVAGDVIGEVAGDVIGDAVGTSAGGGSSLDEYLAAVTTSLLKLSHILKQYTIGLKGTTANLNSAVVNQAAQAMRYTSNSVFDIESPVTLFSTEYLIQQSSKGTFRQTNIDQLSCFNSWVRAEDNIVRQSKAQYNYATDTMYNGGMTKVDSFINGSQYYQGQCKIQTGLSEDLSSFKVRAAGSIDLFSAAGGIFSRALTSIVGKAINFIVDARRAVFIKSRGTLALEAAKDLHIVSNGGKIVIDADQVIFRTNKPVESYVGVGPQYQFGTILTPTPILRPAMNRVPLLTLIDAAEPVGAISAIKALLSPLKKPAYIIREVIPTVPIFDTVTIPTPLLEYPKAPTAATVPQPTNGVIANPVYPAA
jgi:hypothetical protein